MEHHANNVLFRVIFVSYRFDNTISVVTGDSFGCIAIYDAIAGTFLQGIRNVHQSNILCLSATQVTSIL